MQVVNLHTQPLKSRSRPATCSAPAGRVSSLLKRFGATAAGHTSHRLLRVPPIRLLLLPESHPSQMRTGKTHRLTTCATGAPRGAARAREPALLGHRSAAGGLVGEARMAKRRKHRASGGQDARSERPAMGTGSPELRERLRINCYQDQFPAPKGSLPVAGAVAGAAAGFAVGGARGPAAWPSRSMAASACFIAAASSD